MTRPGTQSRQRNRRARASRSNGGREPGCPRAGCLLLFSPGPRLGSVRLPPLLRAVTARESPRPAGPGSRPQGLAGGAQGPSVLFPRQGHSTAWRCARARALPAPCPRPPAGSPSSTAESLGLPPCRCPISCLGNFPSAAFAPIYRARPRPEPGPTPRPADSSRDRRGRAAPPPAPASLLPPHPSPCPSGWLHPIPTVCSQLSRAPLPTPFFCWPHRHPIRVSPARPAPT